MTNNDVYPGFKSAAERDAYQKRLMEKILEAANQIGNRNKASYIWNYTK